MACDRYLCSAGERCKVCGNRQTKRSRKYMREE